MDTLESIYGRRSIRRFKADKVPDELLEKVIQAAAFSPSWKNTQITRYIAIKNEEIRNRIANECTVEFNKNSIVTAPMLLAVTAVKKRSGYEKDGSFSTSKGSGWEMFDCGIATQTLCLAAYDLGLGTVILGYLYYDKVSQLLGLEEEQELVALVGIGYPDEEPVAPKRKPVDELLRFL